MVQHIRPAMITAILVASLASTGYFFANASASSISAGTGKGEIVFHAHRIASADWAPCFALICNAGTGPGASMYFLVYNSTGVIVAKGFADESGTTVTGLTIGAKYIVSPTDCDLCHNSTHNVVFDHWGDGSTSRQLQITVQSEAMSLDAYYKIVELTTPTPSQTQTTIQPQTTTTTPSLPATIAVHNTDNPIHSGHAMEHGLKLGIYKHMFKHNPKGHGNSED